MPSNQLIINYRLDSELPWTVVNAAKADKLQLYAALVEAAEAEEVLLTFADSLDLIYQLDSADMVTTEEWLELKGVPLSALSKSVMSKLQNKVGEIYKAKYQQGARKVHRPGKNSKHTRRVNAYVIPRDNDILETAYGYVQRVAGPLPDLKHTGS